jgi:hypothetical protein
MRQSEGQNWTPGRLGAPVGTQEWADAVRLELLGMVEHLGEDDESFIGWIDLLQEHRAWSLLTKRDGSTFRTREEFCSHQRPWGLGTPWERLRPYVVAGLAKRGMSADAIDRHLALDGVPEATPIEERAKMGAEKRWAGEDDARGNDCPTHDTPPDRTIKQLRAINRAPDAVKDAYREGRISQTLAAKLGPKDPDPDTAALIAAISAEVRDVPERKKVDAIVRERLRVPAPVSVRVDSDPAAFARRLVEKFGREWCVSFMRALEQSIPSMSAPTSAREIR